MGLFSVSKSSMYLNVLLKFFAAWLFCLFFFHKFVFVVKKEKVSQEWCSRCPFVCLLFA